MAVLYQPQPPPPASDGLERLVNWLEEKRELDLRYWGLIYTLGCGLHLVDDKVTVQLDGATLTCTAGSGLKVTINMVDILNFSEAGGVSTDDVVVYDGTNYIPTNFANVPVPVNTIDITDHPYSVDLENYVVLCDCSGGNITATLPAVSGNTGKQYHFKKIDSSANALTIDGSGSETIDDDTDIDITLQYEAVSIVCDGSEWWIL